MKLKLFYIFILAIYALGSLKSKTIGTKPCIYLKDLKLAGSSVIIDNGEQEPFLTAISVDNHNEVVSADTSEYIFFKACLPDFDNMSDERNFEGNTIIIFNRKFNYDGFFKHSLFFVNEDKIFWAFSPNPDIIKYYPIGKSVEYNFSLDLTWENMLVTIRLAIFVELHKLKYLTYPHDDVSIGFHISKVLKNLLKGISKRSKCKQNKYILKQVIAYNKYKEDMNDGNPSKTQLNEMRDLLIKLNVAISNLPSYKAIVFSKFDKLVLQKSILFNHYTEKELMSHVLFKKYPQSELRKKGLLPWPYSK
jgi:hypothetical protein